MTSVGVTTRLSHKPSDTSEQLVADICIIGSGAAGLSAALEASVLGKRVVLVEAAPNLGGQAVNSVIGTFCGCLLYTSDAADE